MVWVLIISIKLHYICLILKNNKLSTIHNYLDEISKHVLEASEIPYCKNISHIIKMASP